MPCAQTPAAHPHNVAASLISNVVLNISTTIRVCGNQMSATEQAVWGFGDGLR